MARENGTYGDDDDDHEHAPGPANGRGGYSWEEEYTRSWDVVQEDQSGSLEGAVQSWLEQGRRRRCVSLSLLLCWFYLEQHYNSCCLCSMQDSP